MTERLRIFGASFVLYVAACSMPALLFQHGAARESQWGFECLLLGVLTLFSYVPAWLANVTLVPANVFLLLGWRRASMVFAATSIALALTTLLWFRIELPGDEGGVTTLRLFAPLPGFFFWLASMTVVLIGALRLSPNDAP